MESRRGYEEATMDRQWEKTLGLKQEVQRLLREAKLFDKNQDKGNMATKPALMKMLEGTLWLEEKGFSKKKKGFIPFNSNSGF